MSFNRNFGKPKDENSVDYAPIDFREEGIFNPLPSTYHERGWYTLNAMNRPTEPAGDGKHWEKDGYEISGTDYIRKWKAVDNPKVYRKFSKLKIYGAIVSLPPHNDVDAWNAVKAWLEAKTINGVNGWMAFQLAQEISEDHPLFAALSEEARVLLGLSTEQFEALLNQCILEG